jgi:two-component system, NarL family, sensor histidine kinase UhpB
LLHSLSSLNACCQTTKHRKLNSQAARVAGFLSGGQKSSGMFPARLGTIHRAVVSLTMIAVNIMQKNPKTPELRILHLEDSAIDHHLVLLALKKTMEVIEMERVETLEEFRETLSKRPFDVILADYRLSGFTALDAWNELQQVENRPPVILLSGAIGEPAAVEAIQRGISDYLSKDNLNQLHQVIRRTLDVQRIKKEKLAADLALLRSERRLAEFAEHLQLTIDQERAAIAREIHDDIGGALAAVKFDVSWIGRHTNDPSTQAHVKAANEMLQHALDASQRIMMNLRPAILDQGLVAAVQWLATSFARRTSIDTHVNVNCEQEIIDKAVQLVAFRTAQEALTNISKHARCSRVTIELTDTEGHLTLEIRDNGQGILRSELDKPKSFGIGGLRERAKTVGGWLDVSSPPGSGAAITLSVPLGSIDPTSPEQMEQYD